LGLPAHAVDAYEVAAADAAAASAAAAARAATPNVGKFNAAAGGSDGAGTAPIAATAPAIAAPPNAAAPAIRADAADSKFIAQAAAPSEAASALSTDADNAHKTEHMHVLRSNSLDFSHPHAPPPSPPLPEPLTPTEATATPGAIHRADTPVDASPETGNPADIRAAVAPAEATAATAAVPAEAPAGAQVATGSTENLGARIAALGGRARRLVDKKPNAVVVVGGSDGSGTRSVVALLEKLGVFMVVDDRGTNDVHAAEMGGWPPVVSGFLKADAVVVMEEASAFVSRSLLSNHRHQDVHAMHTVGTFLEMLEEYWKTRNRRVLSSADICIICIPAPFCLSEVSLVGSCSSATFYSCYCPVPSLGEPCARCSQRGRLRGGQVATQRARRHARKAGEVHQFNGQAGGLGQTARGEEGRRGASFWACKRSCLRL